MRSEEFLEFARGYIIRKTVDINGGLAKGVEELFNLVSSDEPNIYYIQTTDKHVINERFNQIYLGETLEQAIIEIENECSVRFSLTDREDDGINVELEYYPRVLSFKEAIEYRRTHPE